MRTLRIRLLFARNIQAIALIAIKESRKPRWDPKAEHFVNDEPANARLEPRPFREDWKLPQV